MKHSPFLITLFISTFSFSQYNFGFEEFKPGSDTLKAWNIHNNQYLLGGLFGVDSVVKHSGKYSVSITRTPKDTLRPFTFYNVNIPANFSGEEVTISGWFKTENIENSFTLWARFDDAHGNMLRNVNHPRDPLRGTHDWEQYSTSIPIPEETSNIKFGFILAGNGKIWVDDLNFLVDGQTLAQAKPKSPATYIAKADSIRYRSESGIVINNISSYQNNLSLLGRIWGFLKYFHPTVAKGERNWDFELFSFLPGYLQTKTTQERNDSLWQWINRLGQVKECKRCSDKELEKAIYKPDLDWLKDEKELGTALSSQLVFIRDNRYQGKQYYMNLMNGVQNPVIQNENAYSHLSYPDAGYRLLTLFRYWNLIQYWFPYKHLIGEDWKNVLAEFIPKMMEARNRSEYLLVTQQLIGRVHDTHANIWGGNKSLDSLKGRFHAPARIKFVGEEAVVAMIHNDKLARLSNLAVGDIILSIDGKKTADIIREKLPNLPASNYPTQLRDLARELLRSHDSISTVELKRNNQIIKTQLVRANTGAGYIFYDYSYQKDSSFFFIRPGIGYINLGKIKRSQVDSVFKALEGSKGLIIDNRQYPGDFPIYDISAKLLPEKMEFTKIPVGSLSYPGAFSIKDPLYAGKENKNYYKGEVIILINENTQSSGEFHTMAFELAPKAKVIGSTTAGADGNISPFYLPGGIYTMFSGISILYPDGRETQRIGIVPDIEVKPTIEGIKQQRDELVEKAIELIITPVKSTEKKAF